MAFTPNPNIAEGNFAAATGVELDYLRPNGFKFQVHNIPNVAFFCQGANIPDMTLGFPTQSTPLSDIPYPGDKLTFGDLNIRFLIQEDMTNYTELYNWLVGLGFPEKHSQFGSFIKGQGWRTGGQNTKKQESIGQVSDASLFVLDSNNNPNMEILFKDAFPIALSGLDFDISGGDSPYFVGIASFKYRIFNIKPVT
jgi:hypothetical protein|tara:strand:+ start:4060 stop:4647 length:588 start_codon:yes stop_codon:yes gene_type:complete